MSALPDDALRERAADALARGLAFLERSGDPPTLLRAQALLGERSVAEVIECVSAARSADEPAFFEPTCSALPLLRAADLGCPKEIGGSLVGLRVLADLRALHAPWVEQTTALLTRVQLPDGSWGDPGGARPDARIYATGMLAAILARTRFVRPEVLAGAGAFLAGLWSPERVQSADPAAISAFASFFCNASHDDADAILQWCGRELERALLTRRLDAVRVVRVLLDCDAHTLPGSRLEPATLLEAVLAEQAPDGGFGELEEASARGARTLDALKAVIALCGPG